MADEPGGAAGGDPARCPVVLACGELDLCSAAEFRAELTSGLARADPACLVVDLSGVTFLDCSGLRELCAAWRRATTSGGWVRLVYGPRHARVFRATQLSDVFPRYASVSDAWAGRAATRRFVV